MTTDQSHECRVLLSNGTVVHFTTHELRGFLFSSRVAVLLVGALLILSIANPTLFPTLPDYSSRLLYWGVCVCLYVLIVPHWSGLVSRLWGRITDAPLPLIIGSMPLVIALLELAAALPLMVGDLAPDRGVPIGLETYVKNIAIAHVLESIALAWLLPLYRAGQARRASKEDDQRARDGCRFVVLNGRSFPLKSIKCAQSAEHYLVITMETGVIELRARMRDFLEQVGDDDGIQTHRSFWVSATEAASFGGMAVSTRSVGDIPVSRGRVTEVRDWLQRAGKPH